MTRKMQITCLNDNPDDKIAYFCTIPSIPVSFLVPLPGKFFTLDALATERRSLLTINSEPVPDEAQGLKNVLLSSSSYQVRTRFSFSKLRRVVVPPVQIPPALTTPNAFNNIVAGAKIPVTKAMWTRHRAQLMQRLPGRVDEKVAR
ncbi:unnamed protein product [Peronospora destructor]|uniref:Uncharacterized protein n=1 Tax=Peronospora destructor TaxID=86335 RepID=A0AAV0VEL1_9STRA|nr:unnamed protein product [Peronospora destructor]